MKRHVLRLAAVALLTVLATFVAGGEGVIWGAGGVPRRAPTPLEPQGPNLLVNGNMEQLPFYWQPPNHYTAGGWLRWWQGDKIPEYDDVREWRPWRYDGDHAQTYFRWGLVYTAGIYQRVAVQPCTYYQFDMYGRNHSVEGANHHARVGIDPLGRQYNTLEDPRVVSLPAGIVWSTEATYLFVWGLHTVTAEAAGNYVTAITFASPEPGYGYYDTFWDTGTLEQAQPPSGRIPGPATWLPDGFITNVTTQTVGGDLTVQWNTSAPASTQVWYRVISPTQAISPTTPLTETVYLPLVARGVANLDLYTVADQTPVTSHQAIVTGVPAGHIVEFVALSRRLTGGVCLTSTSSVFRVTMPESP
jgi:hypothetical protein